MFAFVYRWLTPRLLIGPLLKLGNRAEVAGKESAPPPVLLDVTSMWGMGADARTPMVRRTRVPLVTWTGTAVARVELAWRALQSPQACDRVMYMYPYFWGLTSQMRDYSDMAMVALAFQRTLLYVEDASLIKWCSKDAWLECFFERFSNDRCRRKHSDLANYPILTISAWDDKKKGMKFLEEKTVAALASSEAVIHLKNETRFKYVVNHPSLFPHMLWEGLLRDGLVVAHDDFGHAIDLLQLKVTRPALYHALSLSALRAMLTPIIFKPQARLESLAGDRARELTRDHHDCAIVHLRWTDKRGDGGIALKMSNYNASHVVEALDRIERRSARSYQCLLLMSDDDAGAIRQLNRLLGDTYDIKQVSQIQALFTSQEEYEAYRLQGHEFFTRSQIATRNPARAYAYVRDVLVDVLAVAKAGDYLIGVGSSGVSQLVAQYIGGSRRADSNAFAVWQEDVLGV